VVARNGKAGSRRGRGLGRRESPRAPKKQIPVSSGVAYQMIGTNPESVMVESAVMSGRPKARAVATR